MASLTVYEPLSGTQRRYGFGKRSVFEPPEDNRKPTLIQSSSKDSQKRQKTASSCSPNNPLDVFLDKLLNAPQRGLDEIITTRTQYMSSTLDDFLETITSSKPTHREDPIPSLISIKTEDEDIDDDNVIPTIIKSDEIKNQEAEEDTTEEDSTEEEEIEPKLSPIPSQTNNNLEEF